MGVHSSSGLRASESIFCGGCAVEQIPALGEIVERAQGVAAV
jgi:hypothetical protein